ncbi:MAG: hypothetical protein SFX73_34615 [Kofleriaceae bacterium]|nr:hypothetical protein [Kofleriaceae bacterium]
MRKALRAAPVPIRRLRSRRPALASRRARSGRPWHASLTWDEQLRRGDLDRPQHEYSEAQRWDPDPFPYVDERRDGPWARVGQIEAPALSNTWRMVSAAGYSPGGFARRMRPVPYRELIEERMPARAQRDPAASAAWLLEVIEQEEASLRVALKRVLRERHGRVSEEERGATVRAMAWCHLLAGRCQVQALRELAKAVHHVKLQRPRRQLALF